MTRWTEAEYRDRLAKLAKKPAKYRNVKVIVDGIQFDSKKEAARYQALKLLLRAGKISDLQHHRVFALSVHGVHLGDYESDFSYIDGPNYVGALVVEDVKSAITRKLPLYRWKRKHFEAEYDISITEV